VPQNFLGGPDEEHFRLVHVEIEAKAGPALSKLRILQEEAANDVSWTSLNEAAHLTSWKEKIDSLA
jgi:indoleamine 2,3-dioxygenase